MRTCLALVITSLCLSAVEGGASITPTPGFEPPKAGGPPRALPSSMMAARSMSFEVERLVLTSHDAAGLARWAELAALSYHLAAVAPAGDGQVLFLERAGQPAHLQLPAVIEQDPAVAAALREKIQAQIAERQQAQRALQAPGAPARPAVQ